MCPFRCCHRWGDSPGLRCGSCKSTLSSALPKLRPSPVGVTMFVWVGCGVVGYVFCCGLLRQRCGQRAIKRMFLTQGALISVLLYGVCHFGFLFLQSRLIMDVNAVFLSIILGINTPLSAVVFSFTWLLGGDSEPITGMDGLLVRYLVNISLSSDVYSRYPFHPMFTLDIPFIRCLL